jgi:hypothetical protein
VFADTHFRAAETRASGGLFRVTEGEIEKASTPSKDSWYGLPQFRIPRIRPVICRILVAGDLVSIRFTAPQQNKNLT